MVTMDDAFKALEGYYDEDTGKVVSGQIETILKPLLDDEEVTEIIIGEKTRGVPEAPYISVVLDTANLEQTTSLGGTESWTIPVKIKAIVREPDEPLRGRSIARSLISKARTLLLSSRQLNTPEIVRKVDSNQIVVPPYPFALTTNKKAQRIYYGAGAILNVLVLIDNKE